MERREVLISLQHGGLDGSAGKDLCHPGPDFRWRRMRVVVHEYVVPPVSASKVELRYALQRQPLQEIAGVVAVVDRIGIEIGNV